MIPLSFLQYEVLQKCCRVKTSQDHGSSFAIFRSAIRIAEQPTLLTKSKINRPGYKCSKKTGSKISYSFSS